jgi:hypothetical protein
MRRFGLLLAVLCSIASGRANALIVTNGEQFQVSGPFTSDPTGPVAIISATLLENVQFIGSFPYPEVLAGWHVDAFIGGAHLFDCGGNIPGPCSPAGMVVLQSQFFVFSPTTLSASISFGAGVNELTGPSPPGDAITGSFAIDLEVIGEEPGFSISAAVPEPSTWAMNASRLPRARLHDVFQEI